MEQDDQYIENGFQLVTIIYRLKEGLALTVEDQEKLDTWLAADAANKDLLDNLLNNRFQLEKLRELQALDIPSFSAELVRKAQDLRPQAPVRRLFTPWLIRITVAASLLLLLFGAYRYLIPGGSNKKGGTEQIATIGGATNKATLTLSNGQKVELDASQTSQLADADGAQMTRQQDELIYRKEGNAALTNTLTTPRGGKYRVVLPDGTKVWINSASSLQYPTAFHEGDDRMVTLSGEAYFEVAKNERMPFKVKVNDLEVKVTGTHFNINGYPDENNILTTLFEGGVRVTRNNQVQVLTPGLQAVANIHNNTLAAGTANLKQVLSWKDGLFIFDGKQRSEILRELSRWYDIDIDDRSGASETTFSGIINRNLSLEEVLDLLRDNKVLNGKLEQRRLTILPL